MGHLGVVVFFGATDGQHTRTRGTFREGTICSGYRRGQETIWRLFVDIEIGDYLKIKENIYIKETICTPKTSASCATRERE